MAKRRRLAQPGPPAPGESEFEIATLGPPIYHYPPPEPKARGGMTPMNDGDGLPPLPAPPLDRRRSRKARRVRAVLNRQSRWLDPTGLDAEVRHQLALTRAATNQPDAAVEVMRQAVATARLATDRRILARVLTAYGSLLRAVGRFEESAAALEEALQIVVMVRPPVAHG